MNNREALARVNRDAMNTGDLPTAGLKTDQIDAFIDMAATNPENSVFFAEIPRLGRSSTSGTLPTRTIGSRLLRRKTEAVDDGYRAKLQHGTISYATVGVRFPAEISEDFFRYNISREDYEGKALEIIVKQVGVDVEDLFWNGDESTDSSDDDYPFLVLNDGFIVQITTGGNVLDGSTYNSGRPHENMFFDAAELIPSKHVSINRGLNGDQAQAATAYRWLCSWKTLVRWQRYVSARMDTIGATAFKQLLGDPTAPMGIPFEVIKNNFPDTVIVLDKPMNHRFVYTYNMKRRRTTEGQEAVLRDVRFYVFHLDLDPLTIEADAAAIITNLNA